MGTYYNPWENIAILGRLLRSRTFDGLVAELRPGEVIFSLARVHHSGRMAALHLDSQAEFTDSSRGSVQGHYDLKGYWAVEKSLAEKEGRPKLSEMQGFIPLLDETEFRDIGGEFWYSRIGEEEAQTSEPNMLHSYSAVINALKERARVRGGDLLIKERYHEDRGAPLIAMKVGIYKRVD